MKASEPSDDVMSLSLFVACDIAAPWETLAEVTEDDYREKANSKSITSLAVWLRQMEMIDQIEIVLSILELLLKLIENLELT